VVISTDKNQLGCGLTATVQKSIQNNRIRDDRRLPASNGLCTTWQSMRNVLSALALVALLAGAVGIYVATTPAVACMGSRC
jgi:hypothetical protein